MLPIIAASTIRSRRGGMMVGVLSAVMYVGLVLAQYCGRLAARRSSPGWICCRRARIALFTVGLNVFGFLAVAVLSG